MVIANKKFFHKVILEKEMEVMEFNKLVLKIEAQVILKK